MGDGPAAPEVRFGTDGVRGVANSDITPEIALAVGRAAVRVFGSDHVFIGRDTRRSGPLLESAVAAGVCAEGATSRLLGVVPTPAVACGSARDGVVGIMISASHNPYPDNGIKLFAPGGRKLTDDEQAVVEAAIAQALATAHHRGPTGAGVGTVEPDAQLVEDYVVGLLAALEGRTLDGLRLVVDCANGSNSTLGPEVLRRLGAEVQVLSARPDGTNINDGCGSNHPGPLQEAVVASGADAGIAFDGDADRLAAVDHTGSLVDGDHIIALCASDLRARGLLARDTVVVTVMSNLGFRRAMEAGGIAVVETRVGDRYVLEAMADGGYSLGGEQSGHIVFGGLSTTGDGLLSAVVLLDLLVRSGRTLADLASGAMTRLPQVLLNVAVPAPMPDVAERLAPQIAAVESDLAGTGRVLLRPSGTEPVVRVMAEAPTAEQATEVAQRLVAAVEQLTR